MPPLPELRQRLQKILGDAMSKMSSAFMELSASLKTEKVSAETTKKLDALFKMQMEANRVITAEINSLIDQQEKFEKKFDQLGEERRKLEALYTSGILFSSETEMKSLMEKAIDVVVRELSADEGFIILTDAEGKTESLFARNMNPDEHKEAIEMSSSVIRQTLANSKPTHITDTQNDDTVTQQNSIARLGITAALCVPLVSQSNVLGAVYLDRRNKEKPFLDSDVVFLLSFAKQIVHGLEVSLEISTLEKKLLSEAFINFEDLRKEFLCEEIIGTSKKLFDILKVASKVATTDASVVLLGENGTGKDALANAIHNNSRRAGKPFVVINCGAIPSDLLESELFGYESGAFTGATKSKPGKLELANGGTVFFDEVAEMSVNLQAKLLRVIQTKEIERLGGVQSKKIDVRFLAATNRNIAEMITQGKFREDLYYRLKVIELTLPPLRERREDILELSNFFLKKYSAGNNAPALSNEALDVLEQYQFPGNIRELENIIQRAIVLSKNPVIEPSDLPAELVEQFRQEPPIRIGKTLMDAETEFRRMFIIKTLRTSKSKSEAAEKLGINRTHFHRLLSQLEIEG